MRGISPAPHLRRFSSTISAYQLLVTYDNAPRHPIREIFIKKMNYTESTPAEPTVHLKVHPAATFPFPFDT